MYFESSLYALKKSRKDILLRPLFPVPLTLCKPIWLQFLNTISAEFLFCAVDPYTERVRFEILYNYPPKGRWIMKRSVEVYVYLALLTHPEALLSVPNQLDKNEKSNFLQIKNVT